MRLHRLWYQPAAWHMTCIPINLKLCRPPAPQQGHRDYHKQRRSKALMHHLQPPGPPSLRQALTQAAQHARPPPSASSVAEDLHPVAEAHLCQLAAYENYAPHGMHVKFDHSEAASLERSATDLALQASMHHAELAKCVQYVLNAQNLLQILL